jgi:hypothetical protein
LYDECIHDSYLLDAFTAKRNVRPHGHFGCHWTDFREIWYLGVVRKLVKKIEIQLKSDKSNGYFYMKACV